MRIKQIAPVRSSYRGDAYNWNIISQLRRVFIHRPGRNPFRLVAETGGSSEHHNSVSR